MSTEDAVQREAVDISERDERTRSRLIRAAVQVFDRKGYDAASVREIVELAGVTKPALYYHFGSKEGLLATILKEGVREFQAALDRVVECPGCDTRERLGAVADAVFGLFERHLPVVRVCHAVFFGPACVAPDFDFTAFDRALVGALERVVAEGQAHGEVSGAAPGDIALAIMGVIGAVAGRQLHGLPAERDRLRRVLDLVFDGVLKNGSHGQAAGEERQ
jgi:AcrR family transcriptional regulator